MISTFRQLITLGRFVNTKPFFQVLTVSSSLNSCLTSSSVFAKPLKENLFQFNSNKPDFNSNKPDFNSNKPDFNSNKPDFNSNKPDFNSNKPDFNSNKPDFNSNKPDFNSNKPDFNSNKPDCSNILTSTSKMTTNRFSCDYARLGTSSCKKCKQKLEKSSLRLAKVTPNPFGDGDGDMKQYFHPKCMFETFIRARATTKVIDDPDDIESFSNLKPEDQDVIIALIKETSSKRGSPSKAPKKTAETSIAGNSSNQQKPAAASAAGGEDDNPSGSNLDPSVAERDNSFREFRKLCANIAEENSHTGKTAIVANYLRKGASGAGFQGDAYLLLKLLLPGVVKTVYNLHDKQLVKIFSQIFGTNLDDMVENLELGDVSETVCSSYERSTKCPPNKKSTLSLQEVDQFLDELSQYTKEDEQTTCLTKITKRCTSNDLKMVVRLIKHDIRINCGAKLILDGLDPDAHDAFKASRNLRNVVDRVLNSKKGGLGKKLSVKTNLMTPVQPMLAEACKSVEQAFRKCPNGMYAEIKYDGERVQVHKRGDTFQYFSRSLKPVLEHKVKHFKDFIPKAFPNGNDLILDSEVLLIDTNTSQPLPFGTLGVHKKKAFQDANVCLFVFDCLHYNGESLMQKPIKERREILRKNMVEIKNHIMFSEIKHITKVNDLNDLMNKVFREGLEGLVLKDVNSIYEPGMRHWLKVKKDYLAQGAMADSADLVVLGAYFGTGNKGGLKSVFLMGVYDEARDRWCTVTKCGSGFDDKTLEKLQTSIAMNKISKDVSQVPKWLNVTKTLTPDFVVQDPKKSPVWEIIGTEFSKSDVHTAGGISIRFPRLQKFRDDKSWKEATNLERLKELFEKSKERSDFPENSSETPTKKNLPVGKARKRKSESDEEEGTILTPVKKARKQVLQNTFSGKSFFLGSDLDAVERSNLRRRIIAYDGNIVDEYEKDSADYVVGRTTQNNKSGAFVKPEWVWNCCRANKVLPIPK